VGDPLTNQQRWKADREDRRQLILDSVRRSLEGVGMDEEQILFILQGVNDRLEWSMVGADG